jgi:hypothetical protein
MLDAECRFRPAILYPARKAPQLRNSAGMGRAIAESGASIKKNAMPGTSNTELPFLP